MALGCAPTRSLSLGVRRRSLGADWNKGKEESLRCACGTISLNLLKK